MKVAIKLCDLAVVGGGIAGLSIAERVAREARRQNKLLKVLLIDSANALGTGASGSLEGWFHSGALYSTFDDTPALFTFLNSFEDLLNWYRCDPLFAPRGHCNLKKAGESCPRYDLSRPRKESWFYEELPYIVPIDNAGVHSARFSHSQRYSRAATSLTKMFHSSDWKGPDGMFWQAPHQGLGAGVAGPAKAVDGPPQDAIGEGLQKVINRLTSQAPGAQLGVMATRDSVMNSWLILSDLARSAAELGVETLLGCELDPSSIQIPDYGEPETISGIVIRSACGAYTHVIARQYVFALGAGFDELTLLKERFGIRIRVKKTTSVMVATKPALYDASFVCVEDSKVGAFNHVLRRLHSADSGQEFSLLADGNALSEDASLRDCAGAANSLLLKTERTLGTNLSCATATWFSCKKTEFPLGDGVERRYAYWWGPSRAYWITEQWRRAREPVQQRTAEDRIFQNVIHGNPRIDCGDLGDLSGSSWALKKALHYALLVRVHAQRKSLKQEGLQADAVFRSYQRFMAEAFSVAAANGKSHSAPPDEEVMESQGQHGALNFLCVVPGKFSLFPSLAHNVYLELEARGLFLTALDGFASARTAPPVALPWPERLLIDAERQTAC